MDTHLSAQSERVALVTGATGFMAHHLIPTLLDRGWEVRATARGPRPAWLAGAVGYGSVDLADPGADLKAVCAGVDTVFHLAGATSSLSSPEEMHQSNAVATANLVEGALGAGVGRFVHMGSTSVYGEEEPLPQPVVETVEPHPSRGYGKAKWLAEQAVWAGARKGLPAVVLRPVSVFGPGAIKLVASAVLDVAIERFAGQATFAVERAPVELRLVHIADVVGAAMHLATADLPQVEGKAYNVVAPWYPSALELAALITTHLGLELQACEAPPCGLSLTSRRKAWEAMTAGGMVPAILFTDERLRFLKKQNRNNRLSIDALLGTGYALAYGTAEAVARGMRETIDWYLAQGWIR
ncbi:MAG TPA: NAD(P)-dependent oxidoreductase [Actinomycetota bacterium]|nr:NAD(P)-dependent oxidoreductase [Actinomycetota bacterium]